jgi:hypothetical protein
MYKARIAHLIQRLGYGLKGSEIRVQVPTGARDFYFPLSSLAALSACHPRNTWRSSQGVK